MVGLGFPPAGLWGVLGQRKGHCREAAKPLRSRSTPLWETALPWAVHPLGRAFVWGFPPLGAATFRKPLLTTDDDNLYANCKIEYKNNLYILPVGSIGVGGWVRGRTLGPSAFFLLVLPARPPCKTSGVLFLVFPSCLVEEPDAGGLCCAVRPGSLF